MTRTVVPGNGIGNLSYNYLGNPYVPVGHSVKVTYTFTDIAGNIATCEFTRYAVAYGKLLEHER